jgi:hypothetical protein
MARIFDYQLAKQRPSWHPPLVALPAVRDLLISAKHLFVEAMTANCPAPGVKKLAAK